MQSVRPRFVLVFGGLAPLFFIACFASLSLGLPAHSETTNQAREEVGQRTRAQQLFKAGNFRESLEIYRQLVCPDQTVVS